MSKFIFLGFISCVALFSCSVNTYNILASAVKKNRVGGEQIFWIKKPGDTIYASSIKHLSTGVYADAPALVVDGKIHEKTDDVIAWQNKHQYAIKYTDPLGVNRWASRVRMGKIDLYCYVVERVGMPTWDDSRKMMVRQRDHSFIFLYETDKVPGKLQVLGLQLMEGVIKDNPAVLAEYKRTEFTKSYTVIDNLDKVLKMIDMYNGVL